MRMLVAFRPPRMRVLMLLSPAVRVFGRGFCAMGFGVAMIMSVLVGMGVLVLMAMSRLVMRMLVRVFVRVGMLVQMLMRLFGFHKVNLDKFSPFQCGVNTGHGDQPNSRKCSELKNFAFSRHVCYI
jgi:hypothetical protein